MKIILLKDIHKVGKKYDVVTVADGYALNSLIPNKAAEVATDKVVEKYTKLKEVEIAARLLKEEELVKELGTMADKKFVIEAKANEQGHLFAAIRKEEVAEALNIDSTYVHMDAPIKEVGNHGVTIKVRDMAKEVTVTVNAKA